MKRGWWGMGGGVASTSSVCVSDPRSLSFPVAASKGEKGERGDQGPPGFPGRRQQSVHVNTFCSSPSTLNPPVCLPP